MPSKIKGAPAATFQGLKIYGEASQSKKSRDGQDLGAYSTRQTEGVENCHDA